VSRATKIIPQIPQIEYGIQLLFFEVYSIS